MSRNYRAARISKKWKMKDVIDKLGISQPTLSAWEGERKAPGIENLEKMADLYEVSTDYLLGRTPGKLLAATDPIPTQSLLIFDGKPVWSPEHGWMLVNAVNRSLTLPDGNSISFEHVGEVFSIPPAFMDTEPPHEKPLTLDAAISSDHVWVEPISPDRFLREELRGWYSVYSRWVDNSCGNKFFFNSYGVKWLAFSREPR